MTVSEEEKLLRQEERAHEPQINVSPVELSEHDRQRRESTASTTNPALRMFWRSPIAMISTLLLGLGSALALHGYYSILNGDKVGNADQQQNALR